MSVGDSALKKSVEEMRKRVNLGMRAITLEGTKRIMMGTPVDIGRARANWNGTVGEPDLSTDDNLTKADVPGKLKANQDAARKVDFYAGEVFVLANGLPYIEALEHGHSKQAPAGMVALTIAELQPLVAELARNVEGADHGE